MKVLSIKELFATLLMKNIKHIETRSWKTNYRGPLYIHASGKKLAQEFLSNDIVLNLTKDLELNNGYIIAKGNLVDCIYMNEKFINNIKKNKVEYACGSYEIGRYTWIFSKLEPIDKIPAKGKLNIWNY